jgi:ubiquinone/menaquinone biosynthesis C-methylase UbiE
MERKPKRPITRANAGKASMRHALDPFALRRIYDRLAGRYDVQHALITAGGDGRGRRALVSAAVHQGDRVLDAGGGTGSTGLLAAGRAGAAGRVVILDQSRGMLAEARRRAEAKGGGRIEYVVGDIHAPPFRRAAFDVVLSTYSMCPLVEPSDGAAALYELIPPGGRLGVAHSAEPRGRMMRWAGGRLEAWAWRWPGLSMGCRAVSVLPRVRQLGAVVERDRYLGFPLWPFHVFVVRKPVAEGHPPSDMR